MQLEVRGGSENPGDDLMEQAKRYLGGVSQVLQTKALTRGLRAYLSVVRKAAQAAAPQSGAFRTAAGYRSGVRTVHPGLVRGYLYSAGYGNVIEAGFAGHIAPILDKPGNNGAAQPGLGQWLQAHAPEMMQRWGRSAKAAMVHSRAGTPWVIPAFDGVQEAATQAFLEAIVDEVAREVT